MVSTLSKYITLWQKSCSLSWWCTQCTHRVDHVKDVKRRLRFIIWKVRSHEVGYSEVDDILDTKQTKTTNICQSREIRKCYRHLHLWYIKIKHSFMRFHCCAMLVMQNNGMKRLCARYPPPHGVCRKWATIFAALHSHLTLRLEGYNGRQLLSTDLYLLHNLLG